MENDKTYMWIAITTFIALAIGLTVSFMQLQEYQDPQDAGMIDTNPFK